MLAWILGKSKKEKREGIVHAFPTRKSCYYSLGKGGKTVKLPVSTIFFATSKREPF